MVASFGRSFLGDVGAALPTGEADGVGVLADTLSQVSINSKANFGQAQPGMIAALRDVASGLQPGQSAQAREAAVARLRDMLDRPEMANQLGQAMQEVEKVKQANVAELARVLENEAGSRQDQPIMEAVGHTVLNRMQRNETALVTDVSGRYSRGQKPPSPETRSLAIKLLNGQLPDNTGGATHFYQPMEMAHPTPVPKDDKGQYQTESPPKNYEYVPGVTVPGKGKETLPAFGVRPDWAAGMRQVPVKGIPDSPAKFFVAPGSRHVR
jgi:hypothetical protein